MVEFALIAPILIALVFGIISYGYMLSYRQAVSQAAAEGARAAALVPSGLADSAKVQRATSAVTSATSAYGVSCSGGSLKRDGVTVGSCTVQANVACPADSGRRCAVVSISHRYREHPLVGMVPGFGITLPSTVSYTAVVEVN